MFEKDKYIFTSISLSEEEEKEFERLDISTNTDFLKYIRDRLTQDDWEPIPKKAKIIPVRFHKDSKNLFDDVKRILKEKNISFSRIYKEYYNDFVQSKCEKQ